MSANLPAGAPAAPTLNAAQFLASLKFQDGKITLPGAIATLELPSTFRYLGPDDAERLLVQAWSNPPGSTSLGMIAPAGVSPLDQDGWGVIVTYQKDGHVKDDDADSIKYTELLTDMQESVSRNKAARKEHRYAPMQLVGWAEPPSYDKRHHKLYWAKQPKFGAAGNDTLNYNIRVLGREGVPAREQGSELMLALAYSGCMLNLIDIRR